MKKTKLIKYYALYSLLTFTTGVYSDEQLVQDDFNCSEQYAKVFTYDASTEYEKRAELLEKIKSKCNEDFSQRATGLLAAIYLNMHMNPHLALDQLKDLKNPGIAQVNTMTNLAYKLGEIEKLKYLLDTTTEYVQSESSHIPKYRINYEIGRIYLDLKAYPFAIEFFNNARDSYLSDEYLSLETIIVMQAYSYSEFGYLESAIGYYKEIMSISEENSPYYWSSLVDIYKLKYLQIFDEFTYISEMIEDDLIDEEELRSEKESFQKMVDKFVENIRKLSLNKSIPSEGLDILNNLVDLTKNFKFDDY